MPVDFLDRQKSLAIVPAPSSKARATDSASRTTTIIVVESEVSNKEIDNVCKSLGSRSTAKIIVVEADHVEFILNKKRIDYLTSSPSAETAVPVNLPLDAITEEGVEFRQEAESDEEYDQLMSSPAAPQGISYAQVMTQSTQASRATKGKARVPPSPQGKNQVAQQASSSSRFPPRHLEKTVSMPAPVANRNLKRTYVSPSPPVLNPEGWRCLFPQGSPPLTPSSITFTTQNALFRLGDETKQRVNVFGWADSAEVGNGRHWKLYLKDCCEETEWKTTVFDYSVSPDSVNYPYPVPAMYLFLNAEVWRLSGRDM